MKRIFSFIFISFIIFLNGYGQTSTSSSTTNKKDVILIIHQKRIPGKVHRAPMRVPIEVWYDTATGVIEVSCPGGTEAQVYLYDAMGNIVAFSPVANTFFNVSAPGLYTVLVEADGWYAEGTIDF